MRPAIFPLAAALMLALGPAAGAADGSSCVAAALKSLGPKSEAAPADDAGPARQTVVSGARGEILLDGQPFHEDELSLYRPMTDGLLRDLERSQPPAVMDQVRRVFATSSEARLPFWYQQKLPIVLRELIQNARRQTRAQGQRIAVDASVADGRLRLTVENTGGKFTPAQIEGWFKDGYTTKDKAPTTQGVGLTRSRRFVEEVLGGTLTGAPRADGGVAMTIDIPLSLPGEAPSAAAPAARRAARVPVPVPAPAAESVQDLVRRVQGRPVYFDNNLLVQATNGETKARRLLQKLDGVEVVPQVHDEYLPDRASIARSLAQRNPGLSAKDLRVQTDRLLQSERRKARALRQLLGDRLRFTRPPGAGMNELTRFLQANLSAEDAAVVAQTMLSCKAKPCYLLTADGRLARGMEGLRAHPERLRKLAQTLGAEDPDLGSLELPEVILVSR